jgi:small subunit ribosomal protein S20
MKRAESMVSLLGKDVSVTQDVVMKAIVDAESEVMRGATHGVFHKNTASRKISRLVQKAKKAMQA